MSFAVLNGLAVKTNFQTLSNLEMCNIMTNGAKYKKQQRKIIAAMRSYVFFFSRLFFRFAFYLR